MLTVAPRMVNDVSNVMCINHDSVCVAGAIFVGEVHVSLFVPGAAFGEVHVSLFVASAACGEIWNDSRSGKRCNFQWNLLLASAKSSLGGAAGCGLRFLGRIMVGTVSDRSRIGRALEMTFHLFSANFCQMLCAHFAWQAQYLVRLDGVDCCSAHCK